MACATVSCRMAAPAPCSALAGAGAWRPAQRLQAQELGLTRAGKYFRACGSTAVKSRVLSCSSSSSSSREHRLLLVVYVLANMGIWTLSSSRKSFFLLFACSCDAVDAALRQQLQADVQAVHALAVSAALRLNNLLSSPLLIPFPLPTLLVSCSLAVLC